MKLKRIVSVCLVAFMLMGIFAYAETKSTITVYFDRIKLVLNEKPIDKQTLLYSGTTYIPIKATAEMLGLTVSYDDKTKTAYLSSLEKESDADGAKDADATAGAVTTKADDAAVGAVTAVTDDAAVLSENAAVPRVETKATITVYFDRIKLVLNGEPLDKQTLLYSGTTYVPIKAAAEMLGMAVTYDSATLTAHLTKAQEQNPDEVGLESTTSSAVTTPGAVTPSKDQLPPPTAGDVTYGPVVEMGANISDAGKFVTMLIFGRELSFDTNSLTGIDTSTLYKARFNAKSVATLTEYQITPDREGVLGADPGKVDGDGIPSDAIKGVWSGNVLTLSLDEDVVTDPTLLTGSGILQNIATDSAITVTTDRDKKVYVYEKGKYTLGSTSDVRSCKAIGLFDILDKDMIIDIIMVIK